jgi:hypothetical protein
MNMHGFRQMEVIRKEAERQRHNLRESYTVLLPQQR